MTAATDKVDEVLAAYDAWRGPYIRHRPRMDDGGRLQAAMVDVSTTYGRVSRHTERCKAKARAYFDRLNQEAR